MQSDIVSAARWLGASILLASGVLVGGLRWARTAEPAVPTSPAMATAETPAIAPGSPAAPILKPKSNLEICWNSADYRCIPILDATSGVTCLDPPGEAEVWDEVAKSRTDPKELVETQRSHVRIEVEKIGEKVDPCKVFPLAGPCELIHCHYKCIVHFDEKSTSDDPVPFARIKQRVEVVYIDKDHLRRCGGSTPAVTVPSASSDAGPGTETSPDHQSGDPR